jgi:hypothetical protein
MYLFEDGRIWWTQRAPVQEEFEALADGVMRIFAFEEGNFYEYDTRTREKINESVTAPIWLETQS